MNSQESFKKALSIVQQLQNGGFEAYFCGGYVRDTLLNRNPKDIDIATSALPDQVEAIFGSNKTVQCGKNFLVCRVNVYGEDFEVATFRVEGGYKDGRHPTEVRKGTLLEDAQRRDLTINALYLNPNSNELVDPTGQGVDDLVQGIVRFVGNPVERIREDHIRILRAIRFGSQESFELEHDSIKAIVNNVRLILASPSEAIKDELNKGFTSSNVDVGKYFDLLYLLGVFKALIPEIDNLYGCEQTPKHHPEGDVFQHVKLMLELSKRRYKGLCVPMAWSILMHDIAKPHTKAIDPRTGYITNHGHAEEGEPIARRIMEDLRFDNHTIDAVCYGVKNHMKFAQAKKMKKHKLIRLLKHEHGPLLLKLHWVDCAASNGLFDNFHYSNKILAEAPQILAEPKVDKIPNIVNGKDLLDLGYKQGMTLGVMLHEICDLYLDGEITTKEQAMDYAKKQLNKTASG